MPSALADSIQITKMSEAFGQQLPHFELVMSGDWRSPFTDQTKAAFRAWYGVQHPFQLTPLPILWRAPKTFNRETYAPRGYIKAALLYARWCRSYAAWRHQTQVVVYTRTPFFVPFLLQQQHSVVLEYHEPLGAKAFKRSLWQHPQFLGMVTTGTELAEGYHALGLQPHQLCIQPNAAATELFQPPQTRSAARAALDLNLGRDRPVLLYAGQLYDYKGVPLLLGLAARLPHCDFVLVGGIPKDVERVRALVTAQQLTNVQLTGHVSQQELPNYLYAADILLLPTSKEWNQASVTSPLKLFDYMSVRRPVVASDLPNIATVLQDGHNGRLAQSDDVDSFVGAIADLLANPQQAQELAQRAYELVRQRTWGDRAQRIIQFIEQRLGH